MPLLSIALAHAQSLATTHSKFRYCQKSTVKIVNILNNDTRNNDKNDINNNRNNNNQTSFKYQNLYSPNCAICIYGDSLCSLVTVSYYKSFLRLKMTVSNIRRPRNTALIYFLASAFSNISRSIHLGRTSVKLIVFMIRLR